MRKFLVLAVFLFLIQTFSFSTAMGGMGGGGGPCPPFSPCWCAQHPTHPNCATPVPIDDEIIFLIISGLGISTWYLFKSHKKKTSQ